MAPSRERRRSQVVRQRSAKPPFVGSIPTGASALSRVMVMSLGSRLLPGAALLVLFPVVAPGQGQPQSVPLGAITGVVRAAERGPALAGARVTLVGTTLAVITGSHGEFSFSGLIPGKYVIQC